MAKLKIRISFDAGDALEGFALAKEAFRRAIAAGVRLAAKELLKDTRPYIPLLTGKLRDSGRVEDVELQMENYAFKLVWDAANPLNNYIYAQKQYEEVLNHIDGRYAAKWLERTLEANPERYVFLANRFVEAELQRELA